jgi:hypothetical protein
MNQSLSTVNAGISTQPSVAVQQPADDHGRAELKQLLGETLVVDVAERLSQPKLDESRLRDLQFLQCTLEDEGVNGHQAVAIYFFSSKEKIVPFPGSLDTVTLLLWASTICLTMASPSPVPPTSRERALSTR